MPYHMLMLLCSAMFRTLMQLMCPALLMMCPAMFPSQELPIHLIAVKNETDLKTFLTDWDVFDQLYSDDYSAKLLEYWRKVRAQRTWAWWPMVASARCG